MLYKINKFIRLSSEEKKLFMEAYSTLGMMRLSILMVSFKHLTRSLSQKKEKNVWSALDIEEKKMVDIISSSIRKASQYTPWESACLVQSLTAQKMLQKRNISGVFYLGVMKDKEGKNKMKAHAWSQCGDIIITGEAGHEEFTVLSVFEWDLE